MEWRQLKIQTTVDHCEAIEAWLLDQGALSVTLLDAADQPILEPAPGETPLWAQVVLVALFDQEANLAGICREFQKNWPEVAHNIATESLPDRVWETAWMDHFEPMRFGANLWIVPSWTTPPDPDAVNIFLDPGLAFGSGTHETTALCLEWLAAQSLTGKTVIDYGCGSGILGIAAAALGADHVLGLDIDPQAITASRDNAEKNNVLDKTTWQLLEPRHLPVLAPHDILLANILAEPLRTLASVLAQGVRAGGQIALSGLLTTQSDEISQIYDAYFVMNPPVIKGDWALLTGRRRH